MMVLGAFAGFTIPAKGQIIVENILPMTTGQQALRLVNTSDYAQTLWISKPVLASEGLSEDRWDVPAHSKLEVPLEDYKDQSFLRLEATSASLQTYWQNRSKEGWALLPWGTSNELLLGRGAPHLTIWVSNSTALSQKVELIGADNNSIYKSWQLGPYETKNIVFRGTAGALKLQGEYRIGGVASDALLHQALSFKPQQSSFVSNGSNPLFEVSNATRSESFVIEISDPKLIASARAQIQDPAAFVPRLLVAQISEGSANLNRDLSSTFLAPWSWHIQRVIRFADFASIDCDGGPSLVEKTFPWWQESKGGLICFWGYRVIRELQP